MSALKSILPQLPRIKALAEKATPGPWNIDPDPRCWKDIQSSGREVATTCVTRGQLTSEDEQTENAFFIAAARTDVPALVEALEEARELLTQAEAELSWADEGSSSRAVRERIREALGQ